MYSLIILGVWHILRTGTSMRESDTATTLGMRAGLMILTFVAMSLIVALPLLAEDTVKDSTSEVDSGGATNTAPDEPESGEGSSSADDVGEGETEVARRESLARRLGVEADRLDNIEEIGTFIEARRAKLFELGAQIEVLEKNVLERKTRAEVLVQQLDPEFPDVVAARMTVSLARARIALDLSQTQLELAREQQSSVTRDVAALEDLAEEVDRRTAREIEAQKLAEERRERAEQSEAAAVEALAEARAREERERDETMRRLLVRQREFAEQMLQLTREHNVRLNSVTDSTAELDRELTDAKVKLLADLEALPPALPNQRTRAARVDPLLGHAREHRSRARKQLVEAYSEMEGLRAKRDEAVLALAEAQLAVDEERGRDGQAASSELLAQRLEVAEAELELRDRQLEASEEMVEAFVRRVDLLNPHERWFAERLDRLIPRATSEAYREGFRLRDENVERAKAGLLLAYHRIVEQLRLRFSQVREVEDLIFSVTVWTWIGGLVLHLIPLGLVLFFLPWVPGGLKQVLARAMSHRVFRRRPGLTIKVFEVVNAIVRPAAIYFAVIYIADYVLATFGELAFGLSILDAFFQYWIAVVAARVIFLPRNAREADGDTASADLGLQGQDVAAELLGISVERARKVVRSVRVVLIVAILTSLVPAFVKELLGVSLVWFWVNRISNLAFAVVFYWVISTWRDEIAGLFEKLASDRIPWAVKIVVEHKDRIYGVLLIAVASIYVLVVELARFGRKYVLNTEWFKKVSTFAFRKRIEMQQREREEEDIKEWELGDLPEDYVKVFEDAPLEDDEFYVAREADYLGEMFETLEGWRVDGKQGSIALISETGVGRTSLLNRFEKSLEELLRAIEAGQATEAEESSTSVDEVDAADASTSGAEEPRVGEEVGFRVLRDTLSRKLLSEADVLGYVADLFQMESTPQSTSGMVSWLQNAPTSVIMIDDCHHFFMRRIGGFIGLDALLEIVALTDDRHFWLLSANEFSWDYVNRVKSRFHQVGKVIGVQPWSESEIRQMIETRNARTSQSLTYADLVVAESEEGREDAFYEVVKSAKGYFRYLHEFSGGNPRIAMLYWLRSLRRTDDEDVLAVTLFNRPRKSVFSGMSDDHWFVLTALAQHDELNAREIADVINSDEGFCALALNFFWECGIVETNSSTNRWRLGPLYFRQVLKQLTNSNYLYS